MARVTVIVFLFESLPGFEIMLNSTLQSMFRNDNSVSNFDKCDPYILNLISQKMNKDHVTKLIPYHLEKNSKEVDVTKERRNQLFINMIQDNYKKFLLSAKSLYFGNEITNNDSDKYPQNTPYLVAIFETLNNLTAQTCGGTLLSTDWVVLPAVCLELLSNYNYLNKTEVSRHNSQYSIVANANNPLVDGTVHNVTEIIMQSNYKRGNIKHPNQTSGSYNLALMKIEPVVLKSKLIAVYKNDIQKNVTVKVYGWILKKDSIGQDVMTLSFITAKTVNSNMCNIKDKDSIINSNSAICLLAKESDEIKVNQMNAGGPVLILSENKFYLLGVAEFEEPPCFVVLPLAAHFDWISDTIRN